MNNTPRRRVAQDIGRLLAFLLSFIICIAIVLAGGVIFGNGIPFSQENPYDKHLPGFHDHRL